jgi:hypothetical protein
MATDLGFLPVKVHENGTKENRVVPVLPSGLSQSPKSPPSTHQLSEENYRLKRVRMRLQSFQLDTQ